MPVPDFSPGEVLTAAAMDSIGLWRVGGGTFSAVSAVDITGFNSSYEYYRLELKTKQTSGASTLNMQLYNDGTQRATDYYGSSFFSGFNNTSGIFTSTNNGSTIPMSTSDSIHNFWCGDIRGMSSDFAVCNYQFYEATNTRAISGTWFHAVSQTNNIIRLTPGSSTISGNWRLYGYREP